MKELRNMSLQEGKQLRIKVLILFQLRGMSTFFKHSNGKVIEFGPNIFP
jgi:hypothetical protein